MVVELFVDKPVINLLLFLYKLLIEQSHFARFRMQAYILKWKIPINKQFPSSFVILSLIIHTDRNHD